MTVTIGQVREMVLCREGRTWAWTRRGMNRIIRIANVYSVPGSVPSAF